MKLLYIHQNPLMIHHVVNELARAGIESQIRNEMIISVMGEGAGFDAWPEVWVMDDDIVKATTVLEIAMKQGYSDDVWICETCGEQNEASFDICWKCNSQGEP
jgi:DUF438 domain-containing protein